MAISAVIFLIPTYDSIVKMPQRTQEAKLDARVSAGKLVWQKHNCNDRRAILGVGCYFASDVTKVMSYRDGEWVARLLMALGARRCRHRAGFFQRILVMDFPYYSRVNNALVCRALGVRMRLCRRGRFVPD